jgi:large repetitive protein
VIGVDMLTMPRGSRMTTTTNRNLGDGNSIFLDTKNGQLLRADFAEGSCSNTVLEQVKRRRTQGEVRSTETEKTGQPALKFEGKSPQYPQQGTDSANQPLVVPRPPNGGTPSTPEQNTPVPKMPGASSNTQGANVRNAP